MLISFYTPSLCLPLSLSVYLFLAPTPPYRVCDSRLTDRMHFSRASSALYNYIYECAHQIEWLTHLHNATWLSPSHAPSPISICTPPLPPVSQFLSSATGNCCLQFQIANGNLRKRAAAEAEGYGYKWASDKWGAWHDEKPTANEA